VTKRADPQASITPPDSTELIPGIRAAPGTLRLQYSRSSGPGGQHVNKTSSKAELWLALQGLSGLSPAALARLRNLAGRRLTLADEIHLSSGLHRAQEANRQAILTRLRELIQQALIEPRPRRKTKPTRASRRRRLESKRHRGATKAARNVRDDD
jgi:ribosome-associated protein